MTKLCFVGLWIGLCLAGSASAQIVIGQTAGFSGAVAAGVKETTDGAKLLIDSVNERGGINGQKIELVSLDDKFDPKIAAVNARTLVTEKRAIALFLTRGTPHAEAILPVLEEFRVPLVAPSTGAMVLHAPLKRWVFNVRSTYQRESEKAVALLQAIGVTTIGVIHVDDSFGKDAMTGAEAGFIAAKLKPAFILKYDRAKPDFAELATTTRLTSPQAVMAFGSGVHVADAQKAIRAAGSRAQVVTLSNNASSGFVKGLGENGRGTIVTQVFPNERSISSPMVKEALTLARARGGTEVSPAMLEGFAAAKILIEGLRRAGTNPTGEKLRVALEAIRGFDVGGLDVTYSPSDHTGLDVVDLSIISKDGRFTR